MGKKYDNILLIEDDHRIRESLADALSDEYNITKAESLAKAWRLMVEGKFPCIIMDVHLPPYLEDHSSGVYLFEKIRREFPNTKIIVISAHANESIKDIFTREGATFIEKPFSLDDIVRAIEEDS